MVGAEWWRGNIPRSIKPDLVKSISVASKKRRFVGCGPPNFGGQSNLQRRLCGSGLGTHWCQNPVCGFQPWQGFHSNCEPVPCPVHPILCGRNHCVGSRALCAEKETPRHGAGRGGADAVRARSCIPCGTFHHALQRRQVTGIRTFDDAMRLNGRDAASTQSGGAADHRRDGRALRPHRPRIARAR